jgi:hypothetical protein
MDRLLRFDVMSIFIVIFIAANKHHSAIQAVAGTIYFYLIA